MEPINLETIDTPILRETNFGNNAQQWLTTLVDKLNYNFKILNLTFAMAQVDIGGGGAGPITVAVTGLLATNFVKATLISSSNPVNIVNIVPGAGSFDITFSADPGASAIIVYQAFASQPQ